MSESKLLSHGESYVFDSWDEFLNALHTLRATGDRAFQYNTSSQTDRNGWHGTASYEACEKLAREGWHGPIAEVERISGHVEDRIDTTIIQTSFDSRFDVCGGEVDIARYLDGEPECMIESEPIRISRHGRAVRVVVPCVFSSATREASILGRGAAVVALADVLAKAQHPLEVWAAYNFASTNEGAPLFQALVRIQRADEPIDIGRLSFVLGHPSSLRRVGFRACENLVTTKKVANELGGVYGNGTSQVDVSQLPESNNTITVPGLSHSGRAQWADEDFCIQWVNDQLDRIFD